MITNIAHDFDNVTNDKESKALEYLNTAFRKQQISELTSISAWYCWLPCIKMPTSTGHHIAPIRNARRQAISRRDSHPPVAALLCALLIRPRDILFYDDDAGRRLSVQAHARSRDVSQVALLTTNIFAAFAFTSLRHAGYTAHISRSHFIMGYFDGFNKAARYYQ